MAINLLKCISFQLPFYKNYFIVWHYSLHRKLLWFSSWSVRISPLNKWLSKIFFKARICCVSNTVVARFLENSRLVESLGYYWDRTKQAPIDLGHIERDFPDSITVPQAVATWKHVTEYKENKHWWLAIQLLFFIRSVLVYYLPYI